MADEEPQPIAHMEVVSGLIVPVYAPGAFSKHYTPRLVRDLLMQMATRPSEFGVDKLNGMASYVKEYLKNPRGVIQFHDRFFVEKEGLFRFSYSHSLTLPEITTGVYLTQEGFAGGTVSAKQVLNLERDYANLYVRPKLFVRGKSPLKLEKKVLETHELVTGANLEDIAFNPAMGIALGEGGKLEKTFTPANPYQKPLKMDFKDSGEAVNSRIWSILSHRKKPLYAEQEEPKWLDYDLFVEDTGEFLEISEVSNSEGVLFLTRKN